MISDKYSYAFSNNCNNKRICNSKLQWKQRLPNYNAPNFCFQRVLRQHAYSLTHIHQANHYKKIVALPWSQKLLVWVCLQVPPSYTMQLNAYWFISNIKAFELSI